MRERREEGKKKFGKALFKERLFGKVDKGWMDRDPTVGLVITWREK